MPPLKDRAAAVKQFVRHKFRLRRGASDSSHGVSASHADAGSKVKNNNGTNEPARMPGSQSDQVQSDSEPLKPTTRSNPGDVSITELWDQAYEDLRNDDKNLITKYESTLVGDVSHSVNPTLQSLGIRISKREQMQNVLRTKMEAINKDTWKLEFCGNEVTARDMVNSVVSIIDSANQFISAATSANPAASIAWAGISMILPLFLNPARQATSLAAGLEYISTLIVRTALFEDLFIRRYESNNVGSRDHQVLSALHGSYKSALKGLYARILKFQVKLVCFISEKRLVRISADMVAWHGWDDLVNSIKEQEETFNAIHEQWRDIRYEEDYKALQNNNKKITERWDTLINKISDLRNVIERTHKDQERRELLGWLSTVDPSENYRVMLERCSKATGDWLVKEDKTFEGWKHGRRPFLWIHGKAGSGKSVLSASIIKHLMSGQADNSDLRTALAYFYFSFSDTLKQDAVHMLESLIKQMYACRPGTLRAVEACRPYKDKDQRPDTGVLEEALVATFQGYKDVYIIIDALDECPAGTGKRNALLEILGRLLQRAPDNLHVLCTSRKEPDIEGTLSQYLSPRPDSEIDLSAQQDAVNRDIGKFIDNALESVNCKWSGEVKAKVKDALMKKAHGMFQYVSCQMTVLRRLPSANAILDALQDLPPDLDSTYDRMLLDVDLGQKERVINCLKWLAYSYRPLVLDEVAEVFVMGNRKPVAIREGDRLFEVEQVLEYLNGLVVVVPFKVAPPTPWHDQSPEETWSGRPSIVLTHFSVKEYLVSPRIRKPHVQDFALTETEAQLHIAQACIDYLCYYDDSTAEVKESSGKGSNYLLPYACQHWANHLKALPITLVRALLSTYTRRCENPHKPVFLWASRVFLCSMFRDGDNTEQSSHEICDALQKLEVGRPSQYLDVDFNSTTSLHKASTLGHTELVNLLLDSGFDVNRNIADAGTALHCAAEEDHLDVVRLLLKRGANIDSKRFEGWREGDGWTPLHSAASCGHVSTVHLLLELGANVDPGYSPPPTSTLQFSTPLRVAQEARHSAIAEYLHNKTDLDIDLLNVQPEDWERCTPQTPIFLAAGMGHKKIVQLLVEKGAEVNKIAEWPVNPVLVYSSGDLVLRKPRREMNWLKKD